MKIYRAKKFRSGHEHDGFEYFTNKAEAMKFQKAHNKAMREGEGESETEDYEKSSYNGEVETLEFEPSKAGILKMLQQYCDYPDNG